MLRTHSIKATGTAQRGVQTCTIGLSYAEDIKLRSRRRWKNGHVYIHSAKLVSEPLTRLPAVISIFRYGAVILPSPLKKLTVTDLILAVVELLEGDMSRLVMEARETLELVEL
jgi:hypothetical protein